MYAEENNIKVEDKEKICEICGEKEYLIEFKGKYICKKCVDLIIESRWNFTKVREFVCLWISKE